MKWHIIIVKICSVHICLECKMVKRFFFFLFSFSPVTFQYEFYLCNFLFLASTAFSKINMHVCFWHLTYVRNLRNILHTFSLFAYNVVVTVIIIVSSCSSSSIYKYIRTCSVQNLFYNYLCILNYESVSVCEGEGERGRVREINFHVDIASIRKIFTVIWTLVVTTTHTHTREASLHYWI